MTRSQHQTPRTDVSPPSRRSAVRPPWAGVSPPSPLPTEHTYDLDHVQPWRPEPRRGVDWSLVTVWLVLLGFCLLAWVGVWMLGRHVWLAVS